ncbi:MAG: PilW family protein [Deltaproteobacteria bacterium]|nr:PilW family protein [Deltaproteobacteria bacterium]
MVTGRKGFTLLEVILVIAILSIIIMMGSETFTYILKGTRKETGTITSQIETTLALNIIRYDVEHAGYGLCKKFMGNINYQEASESEAHQYNDAPSGIPKPILSGNNVGLNGSDRLIVKSVIAGVNETCTKWTYVKFGEPPKIWDNEKIRLKNNERVVVIKPGSTKDRMDELVMDSDGSFFTLFNSSGLSAGFSPKMENEKYIIYGVDPDTNLRMPFNRADYFIRRPTSGMPKKCAPNTAILYKANVNHATGSLNYMPLMDCVADFQIIFGIDVNGDKIVDDYIDDISSYNAQTIRNRIKEIRLYILTHEGKRDRDFKFKESKIYVGEFEKGREFNFQQVIGSGWDNYKWKIYSIVVHPRNL